MTSTVHDIWHTCKHVLYILGHKSNLWENKVGGQLMAAWQSQIINPKISYHLRIGQVIIEYQRCEYLSMLSISCQ